MQAYSAPLNMSLSNVLCKTKNFQTWNQKCLVCVILGFKFKKLLSYLKSATSNLSYRCFDQYSESWHRVRFFCRSGVRFFQRPTISERPVYRVCHLMANTRGVLEPNRKYTMELFLENS